MIRDCSERCNDIKGFAKRQEIFWPAEPLTISKEEHFSWNYFVSQFINYRDNQSAVS
jgi:hypothetical protein